VKPKQRHLIILLAVAALVGVSIYFIVPPAKKTHLGLDLQGGLEVVYKAQTRSGRPPSPDQLNQTLSIINKRVNGLGVSEAQVQKQGSDQISVALPGVRNQEQDVSIVGKTAQLLFYDDGKTRVAGPVGSQAELLKPYKGKVPKGMTVITAAPGALYQNSPQAYFLYKDQPAMTGAAIHGARQSFSQNNSPNVLIDFTSQGGKQFGEVTKQLALTGALKGVPQTFAIVLDGQMESDPKVDPKENPNGIQGGSAEITGNFTIQEAKDLALVLNTGALPVSLTQIMKTQVSATLGKDSLIAGLIAAAVGFAIVFSYLIVYYRFLGLIADIALLIYAVLLYGLFNAIPVTLTLPGIAGMILTIGVAADANVVIFERIKEEVRRGKTVRTAVNTGYGRGFRTILDANVLTLLTAVVLFEFATAQPKGFAFTLILGVLVSMFTAVLATRAMLGLLADFSFFNRPELMGVKSADVHAEAPPAAETSATERRRARARRATSPAAAVASGNGGGELVALAEPALIDEGPADAVESAGGAEPAEAPAPPPAPRSPARSGRPTRQRRKRGGARKKRR
jgi:protein-export membrane protein SecD